MKSDKRQIVVINDSDIKVKSKTKNKESGQQSLGLYINSLNES